MDSVISQFCEGFISNKTLHLKIDVLAFKGFGMVGSKSILTIDQLLI